MGVCPLIPTLNLLLVIEMSSILALVSAGMGMFTLSSASCCIHTYVSVLPPLPSGAGVLSSSASSTLRSRSSSVSGRSTGLPTGAEMRVSSMGMDVDDGSVVSKLPSEDSSNTSSSPLALAASAFFAASLAASSCFFFSAFAFFTLSSFSFAALFFSASFSAMAECFWMTAITVLSITPGEAPTKKSVLRRRKEKRLSSSGSIPCDCWATERKRLSKRSSAMVQS
mmetsp:Transcript_26445/g.58576  ORF Transcript_26445/g.58576 Transcript_26445/m.58576 type:complete len:225 (+) Transcript_26445:539-1213(+)